MCEEPERERARGTAGGNGARAGPALGDRIWRTQSRNCGGPADRGGNGYKLMGMSSTKILGTRCVRQTTDLRHQKRVTSTGGRRAGRGSHGVVGDAVQVVLAWAWSWLAVLASRSALVLRPYIRALVGMFTPARCTKAASSSRLVLCGVCGSA